MLVAFFGEMFQQNVLYDELYQILAGLPTVLIDLSGVRCFLLFVVGRRGMTDVRRHRKLKVQNEKRKTAEPRQAGMLVNRFLGFARNDEE